MENTGGRWIVAMFVVVLAAGVAVTFAPWLRSGSSHRTSYSVVRVADRLDVLGGSWGTVLRGAWAFLPLAATCSAVAVSLRRYRTAAALAMLVGLAEVALAVVVMSSPRSTDWGARGGLAAGAALMVLALVTAHPARSTA